MIIDKWKKNIYKQIRNREQIKNDDREIKKKKINTKELKIGNFESREKIALRLKTDN